jgi:Protein of unknown function (DUF3997)
MLASVSRFSWDRLRRDERNGSHKAKQKRPGNTMGRDRKNTKWPRSSRERRVTMKSVLFLLMVICTVTLLSSCSKDPLIGDWDVQLTGGYRLIRLDEDDVEVAYVTKQFHRCIPAKVVEIGWNKNVIAAKQQHLRSRGNFPGDTLPVPVPGEFSYWIINIKTTNCEGPMTETEYQMKMRSLGEETLRLGEVRR